MAWPGHFDADAGRRIRVPSFTSSPALHAETPPPSRAVPTTMDMAAPSPRLPGLSKEEKQERQRMHVRRSYYKKKGYIRSLKEEVEKLEHEYALALAAQPDKSSLIAAAVAATPPAMMALAHEAVSSPTEAADFLVSSLDDLDDDSLSDDIGDAGAAPASSESVQRFVQLSSLRDSLRHENDELKRALIRYANFVRRVNQTILDTHAELEEDDAAPHLDVLDFYVTPSECRYMTLLVCDEAKRFVENEECLTTGVSLFGWRDKRRVVDGYVEFSVRKFYHNRSVHTLAESTWELMSSPTRFAALFSASMAMELRQVQRVDDDTVVFYRRIDRRRESAGTVSKSIFFVSRIRTSLGHLIVLRACDTPRHRHERRVLREIAESEHETWHDVCSWVLFQELGDQGEHTQFTFGGRFDTSAATPQFWMLEALLLSLRWEAIVVGPLFQLLVN